MSASASIVALAIVALVLLTVALGFAGAYGLHRARHAGFKEAATSALIAARVAAPQQTGRHAANVTAEIPRVTWPAPPVDPWQQLAIGDVHTRPGDEDPRGWY